jgi:hypothetical protein
MGFREVLPSVIGVAGPETSAVPRAQMAKAQSLIRSIKSG